MDVKHLIAKKALYEAKKVELSLDTHEEEIQQRVLEFRRQKEQEILDYEADLVKALAEEKAADEAKIDNYIECINELIEEASKQEIVQEQECDASEPEIEQLSMHV